MTDSYFVSPHLDDVVLSCGGYIRRLVNDGERVVIVTVFTADLPLGEGITWLACRNHLAWRLGDAPYAQRRREDQAAVERLGAIPKHLGMLDATYRRDSGGRPLYPATIVGVPVAADDWATCEPVVRLGLLQALGLGEGSGPQPRVFCPLGIGGHVDHQIVRRAVESLCTPRNVSYYEDYPYAGRSDAVRPALPHADGRGDWQTVTIELSEDEIEARLDAIGCYASQLVGLFPSQFDRVVEILRARLPYGSRIVNPPLRPRASLDRMRATAHSYMAAVGGEHYWQHVADRATADAADRSSGVDALQELSG